MIKSTQTIIKIGSSAGVTIPAKELKRENINFGDEVTITVKPAPKKDSQTNLVADYETFKKTYHETLKNLADR